MDGAACPEASGGVLHGGHIQIRWEPAKLRVDRANTDRAAGAFLIRSRSKGGAFFLVSGTVERLAQPIQRYCSGCSRETAHTPQASGTTICESCGEWRAATVQPSSLAWSSWPRRLGALPM